jgi:outer membrane protein, multidrug efflux system
MSSLHVANIMSRRWASGVLMLACAFGTASCKTSPSRPATPQSDVPATFQEASDALADSSDDRAWWESYGDPQLSQLIGKGLSANADVRLAAARVAESRALLGVSASELYPNVDLAGSAQRVRVSATGSGAPDGVTMSRYALGFQTAWEIDLWGRVQSSINAATFDTASAEAAMRDVQRSIGAEVAAEYMQLRGLRSQLGVAERGIDVQARLLGITRGLFDQGAATQADVLRVESRLDRTRAAVPGLGARMKGSVQRLSVLTTMSSAEIEAFIRPLDIQPQATITQRVSVPSMVLRDRSDIAAAEADLAAECERLGVARASLFPRVTLQGDFGVDAGQIGNLFTGDAVAFGVGPSIRWPLLDFGRIQSQIRAQGARQEAALIRYEQSVRRAIAEVEMALAERRGSLQVHERLSSAHAGAVEAQRLVTLRYEKGAESLLAALDAERERLELDLELIDAQTSFLLADVALHRALGRTGSLARVP